MANVNMIIINKSHDSEKVSTSSNNCTVSDLERLSEMEDALEAQFDSVRTQYLQQVDILKTEYGTILNKILKDINRIRCAKMKVSK